MLAGCARHASFIFACALRACGPAARVSCSLARLVARPAMAQGPRPKKRGPEGPRCYAFWVMRWNSRMASSAVSTSKRFKFFSKSLAR